LWTACVMLLWNPKMLWYDAGFQLSFLAVIGLLETAPYLERWMQRVPQTLGLREALTLTIAAQMFAVPWVIAQFGLLSLISPVANILVAPLIPPAMLFGFLGTTISFVFFPLGQIIAFVGWGCMALILVITETLASLPFAAVQIPSISIFIICLYYSVLISGLVVLHRTRNISPHIHKH
jgi:competence protein ComEC